MSPEVTQPPTQNGFDEKRFWWTIGFSRDRVWGAQRFATYAAVPPDDLPPISVDENDTSWSWLESQALPASEDDDDDEDDSEDDNLNFCDDKERERYCSRLLELDRELAPLNLRIPPALLSLVQNPALLKRIPSASACWLHIGSHVWTVPGKPDARVVDFLHDQQDCIVWYLLLEPGRTRVVLVNGSEENDDDDDDEHAGGKITDIAIAADGVVEFFKRFWIENTLWFLVHGDNDLPAGELADYARQAEEAVKNRKARAEETKKDDMGKGTEGN